MSEMYPWITEGGATWNPLGGRCPHECDYCYVESMKKVFTAIQTKYSGPVRLWDGGLKVPAGNIIFVCSMNDLFADAVPGPVIEAVLAEARKHPMKTFLFQSKNPARMVHFKGQFPPNCIFGTTLETNWSSKAISKAPAPSDRVRGMVALKKEGMGPRRFGGR